MKGRHWESTFQNGHQSREKCLPYRPNAKVPVINLTWVLKTKDHLDDPIVLCMIVRLIVYSAYHYSPFAFGI
jgi:hypothetical protein